MIGVKIPPNRVKCEHNLRAHLAHHSGDAFNDFFHRAGNQRIRMMVIWRPFHARIAETQFEDLFQRQHVRGAIQLTLTQSRRTGAALEKVRGDIASFPKRGAG